MVQVHHNPLFLAIQGSCAGPCAVHPGQLYAMMIDNGLGEKIHKAGVRSTANHNELRTEEVEPGGAAAAEAAAEAVEAAAEAVEAAAGVSGSTAFRSWIV